MKKIYHKILRLLAAYFPFLYRRLEKRKTVIKFFITGGVTGLFDLFLLYLFTDIFGWWYLLSSILAFIIAFGCAFLLHKFWTFEDYGWNRVHKQLALYLFIVITNLAINTVAMYYLVDKFRLWYILAQIIVSLILAATSYSFNKLVTFKNRL